MLVLMLAPWCRLQTQILAQNHCSNAVSSTVSNASYDADFNEVQCRLQYCFKGCLQCWLPSRLQCRLQYCFKCHFNACHQADSNAVSSAVANAVFNAGHQADSNAVSSTVSNAVFNAGLQAYPIVGWSAYSNAVFNVDQWPCIELIPMPSSIPEANISTIIASIVTVHRKANSHTSRFL